MNKYKIIVHVPIKDADAMREAIGNAGGGKIGNYTHCSFSVRGVGRSMPQEGANPHIGTVGKIEEIEEESIEVVVDESVLKTVLKAVRMASPYEEPAIEVYKLEAVE